MRLALAQIARGEEPTGEVVVPGVLSWDEYQKRSKLWSEFEKTVSLNAEFYKGKGVWLFPQDVLKRSLELARTLKQNRIPRRARALGVDAAEGGDDSVWTIIDTFGLIFQLALKTKDTNNIPGLTLGLIKEYRLNPENVVFDRGGGGKQHVDRLRAMGYDVRSIGFGESATEPHQERKTSSIRPPTAARVDRAESRYVYKNRRAEMYGLTSELFVSEQGFAVPMEFSETLRQLKPLPKQYDGEGRLYLPPKDKPSEGYTGVTIKQLLGRSPDHADSLVLAVFGMLRKPQKVMVGGM